MAARPNHKVYLPKLLSVPSEFMVEAAPITNKNIDEAAKIGNLLCSGT